MEYRNAKRLSGNRIDCEINHPTHGWIPFTCDPTDKGSTINVLELYSTMSSDPNVIAYVPPTKTEIDSAKAEAIRTTRDGVLSNLVDPIVSNPLRWAEMTTEKQTEWVVYRRALLDIPQQTDFPNKVIWPIQPE